MTFAKFFSGVQESPWYRQFLNPVVEEVEEGAVLLDIGTGSGKLLQILTKDRRVKCVGVDTSPSMLQEAKKKLVGMSAELYEIKAQAPLPFEPNSFDQVTICNVLFNLPTSSVDLILEEAFRVLKKGGKVLVLTPTGNGNF